MFLTEDDFNTVIDTDQLTKIVGNNTGLLGDSILVAVQEMVSYLEGRYDTAVAFGAVGTARNAFLVLRCADIALYHLYSRVAARNIPELRGVRYGEAIEWLKAINKGNVHLNLPIKVIDNQTGFVLFGGNPQFRFR